MRAGTPGLVAAVAAVLLATGACAHTASSGQSATGHPIRLYGTDGNMSNSFGDGFKETNPGVLAGMKGTTPLTPLSEDFKRRVKAVDGNVTDYNYAGEAYDAVVVAALAAELARTVDPGAIAKQIVGVTTGGTVCETIPSCLALAKAGKDFMYRGISLRRSGFTDIGEPSSAMYGALNYGHANHIDEQKTEYVGVGDEKAESRTAPPAVSTKAGKSNVPLRIGALLSKTGGLGIMGPPIFAGAKLGVKELNEAGGILGQQVAYEEADDGTSASVAAAALDRLIAANVSVIIGAGASGVTKAILPKVIAAGKVMISPSATSDELTAVDDKGLFFRTAPPDLLQAKALADIILRDGPRRVAIAMREDSYGSGLSKTVQTDLAAAGLKPADIHLVPYPAKELYDPKTDADGVFKAVVADLKAYNPDAILLVGFDETAYVIRGLVADGVQLAS